jgi:diguanylate cyclase (GGDEF)-like protein/PAS domain S-box-containing protein
MNLPRANSGFLRLVWPFLVLILAQALLAGISLDVMSSVRAYVGGEARWSRGQKDAIHYLTLYAESRDEQYYRRFRTAIAVPLGDRDARIALEQSPPDPDAARTGFLQGGNDADDIPGMIWLYRNFRSISYFDRAIRCWAATDPVLDQLDHLGEMLHRNIADGLVAPQLFKARIVEIGRINERLAPLAAAYSESLSAGSRAIKMLLTFANMLTGGLLMLLVLWHTRKLMEQREAFENALRAEKQRAQVTLASIGEAVLSTDADGQINYINSAAERLIGIDADDAGGSPLNSLVRIVDQKTGRERDRLAETVLAGVPVDGEGHSHVLMRPNSHAVPVSLIGSPLHIDGKAAGIVLVIHDKTKEQAYIDRLSWQASHDALTGLTNRREFERRLETALGQLDGSGTRHILMFLDIDQFKIVNDTCGHAAGDQLLRQISSILQRHLRAGDLVARLGGDEFGVLLPDCGIETAAMLAETLRQSVQDTNFTWKGRVFNTTLSIGAIPVAHAGTTKEDMLRTADMACYMAKEKGRNRVQIHSPSDSELLERFGEMTWVQRIHDALEQHRFCIYAQEILALDSRNDEGMHIEILLRLRDEDGRLVPPANFIPSAERYGLMPLIDRWVVSNTFDILADGLNDPQNNRLATCAINLSGASFEDENFVEFVREQFAAKNIPPTMICLEITETSAISNLAKANQFLGAMQDLGCRFALDDFGSGMSSFAYLKHLPVDFLKIDGGFIKDMLNDPIDLAMVETIHRLGKMLGKRTIAEFVESEDILARLREIGIDYAQGYVIGKPQPFTGVSDVWDDLERPRRQVA